MTSTVNVITPTPTAAAAAQEAPELVTLLTDEYFRVKACESLP
jgi:hypothetical protein